MVKLLLRAVLVLAVFATAVGTALYFLSKGPFDEAPLEDERLWGVTFSLTYLEQLGLKDNEAWAAVLDDLGVRRIRLPVYWQHVEPDEEGGYDFSRYDTLLAEAEKRDAKVIVTVGRRVPRWPECHVPEWAKDVSEGEQRELVLKLLRAEIEHFKNSKAVWAWQVENEPFILFFGECPKASETFFAREIELVRALDPSRPVVVSDSGELSLWYKAARYADIFATTMYRIVPTLDKKGFTTWKLPPWFYTKKANLVHRIHPLDDVMVIELQAEPWAQLAPVQELTFEEQFRSFDTERFHDNIRYARATNFKEVYLWGVEWWLWARQQGHPEFWNIAKDLFRTKP